MSRKGSVTVLRARMPSDSQMAATHDSLVAKSHISRMNNHDRYSGSEQGMNKLLSLKRDLCCVPGCPRKHIYWTPNGKFCARHRDEATAAMVAFNRKKYGDA